MSWSLSVNGTADVVKQTVEGAICPESQKSQQEPVKAMILGELAQVPDDSQVVLSASGHCDEKYARNISVSMRIDLPQKAPE